MSELLTIIDVDGVEHAVTPANNLRWAFPIEGEYVRKLPSKNEKLARPRPHRRIGSRLEIHPLKIRFGVMGHTRAALESGIDALLWAMDPLRSGTGSDNGQFTLKRVTSAGNTRHALAVMTGYSVDENMLARGGPVVPVDVDCELPDPVWYDPTPVTVSGQFAGSTPVLIACPNSREETWLRMTLSGAVAWPEMVTTRSDYLRFEETLVSGDVLELVTQPDADDFGATLTRSGAEQDWTGRRSGLSKWLVLPPGPTTLTISGQSGDAWLTATFTKYFKVLL